jgi:hypothetical protein
LTWNDLIHPIFDARCIVCHQEGDSVDLSTYEALKAQDGNMLVQVQTDGHPNRLPSPQVEWLQQWVEAGMPK